MRAEDPDTIGQLEYTLIHGDDDHFTLDATTGVLRLIDSLDREAKDLYKLTVRASDGNQHTDTVVDIQVSIFLMMIITTVKCAVHTRCIVDRFHTNQ